MATFWIRYEGKRFTVHPGLDHVLGRSSTCTFYVEDRSVSREHACMRLVGGQLLLEDLGSRNGTFVNGQRITTSTPLRDNDVVVLGTAALQVGSAPEGGGSEATDATGIALSGLPIDETATTATRSMLDVVERLIAQAIGTGRPAEYALTVRSTIDAVLASLKATGIGLTAPEIQRVAAAATVAAAWDRSGGLDAWHDEVRRTLGLERG